MTSGLGQVSGNPSRPDVGYLMHLALVIVVVGVETNGAGRRWPVAWQTALGLVGGELQSSC